ncbi:MAG TPA: hypothetical protein VFF67_02165 [Thermoplasmata archaeon]|nr:hypothetical protein [Thermoplasmata archaeon]
MQGLPGSPPRSVRSTAESVVRRLQQWLQEPTRERRLLLSALLALSFVSVILVYTRGGLLYGQDYPGVYSASDFAYRPIVDFLIPSAAVGVAFGNVYVGFYLALLAEAFLASYAVQLFARELFSSTFSERELTVVQGAAAALYVFSPAALVTSFKSLIAIVFLSATAFLLTLTLVVRVARKIDRGWVFRRQDALLLGVAIGLAAPDSFPNQVRILGLTAVALVVIFLGFALTYRTEAQWVALRRAGRHIITYTLPVAILLLSYDLYLVATQWATNVAALRQVASAYTPLFTNTSYNTLPQVVRLLGKRSFGSLVYSPLYTYNAGVVLASYLWPLLAIAVPVFFAYTERIRERRLLYGLVLVVVLCVIWDTGTNPPFGGINSAILSVLPFGSVLVPTYFLSFLLLSKLYPVLIAFSVGMVGRAVDRWQREVESAREYYAAPPGATGGGANGPPAVRRPRRAARVELGMIVAIALTGVLMVAALPIFEGQVEVGTSGSGFFIPGPYFQVRSTLQSTRSDALLLPALSLYITTSWGFQGANSFYLDFNYPSKVVVPGFWGPYSYYLNRTQSLYANATTAVGPGSNTTAIVASATPKVFTNQRGAIVTIYHLGATYNLSSFAWAALAFHNTNTAAVDQLAAAGELTIGLASNGTNHVGWFSVGGGSNAVVNGSSSTEPLVDLLVGEPSTNVSYNPDNVSEVLVLEQNIASSSYVPFGALDLGGIATGVVQPGWLPLMQSLGVHYVLVDSTVSHGATQSYALVFQTVAALLAAGIIVPEYASPSLSLYRIV